MAVAELDITIDQQSGVPLYEQVCQYFRQKIESKALPVGAQLPTSHELGAQLQVSYKTAHLAMATLAKEGYVTRAARRGTVVKGIPRRGVVGIYCYIDLLRLGGDHESYRLTASHLSSRLEHLGRVHRMYLGSETPDASNTAGEDLLRHLSSGALAGVMLVNTPHKQLEQLVQIGRTMRIPVVALSGYGDVEYSVRIDFPGYVRAASEYLRRRGCKNIGVIYNSSSRSFHNPAVIPNILRDSGFEPDSTRIIGRVETVRGGYDAASQMPWSEIDGLVVQDDVMATGVDRRLCELDICVPRDLLATTFWIRGSHARLTLPFECFEADPWRQVQLALKLMQDAINGRRVLHPHIKLGPTMDPACALGRRVVREDPVKRITYRETTSFERSQS